MITQRNLGSIFLFIVIALVFGLVMGLLNWCGLVKSP